MNKPKILITTAIDYVNDVIHIGHAYQKMLADCTARFYRKKLGDENVAFVTGTDEFGQKVYTKATEKGVDVKDFVDEISKKDQQEQDSLNISYDRFIRTTDEDHKQTASDFFKKAFDAGYIYKATYKGLYCVGCEEYKTEKDLIDGKCPNHPTGEIKMMEEENYFFALSKFKPFLQELYANHPDFVLPSQRFNEMKSFVENLEDVAVTRTKDKLPWGIPCPIDDNHVLWVWFDALVNYYTFGQPKGFWDEDTQTVHFLGKDNARMHAVLWPAMLQAVGYQVPSQIYVNGFLGLNGQKISKSLGNIVRPSELVEKYGVDPVRYYFLRYGPIVEDADFSYGHFEEVYTADLANGLGNTVSRLSRMAEKSNFAFPVKVSDENLWNLDWQKPFEEFRVDLVLGNIWKQLSDLDKDINDKEPWTIKDEEKLKEVLTPQIDTLRQIVQMLEPFMPETSVNLQKQLNQEKISFQGSLFPRI